MIHVAMFDFDQTLADSTRGAVDCVNHALRKMGRAPVEPAAIHQTVGLSLSRTFHVLTGTSDPAEAADFSRWFIERADQVMVELTIIFPRLPPPSPNFLSPAFAPRSSPRSSVTGSNASSSVSASSTPSK